VRRSGSNINARGYAAKNVKRAIDCNRHHVTEFLALLPKWNTWVSSYSLQPNLSFSTFGIKPILHPERDPAPHLQDQTPNTTYFIMY